MSGLDVLLVIVLGVVANRLDVLLFATKRKNPQRFAAEARWGCLLLLSASAIVAAGVTLVDSATLTSLLVGDSPLGFVGAVGVSVLLGLVALCAGCLLIGFSPRSIGALMLQNLRRRTVASTF